MKTKFLLIALVVFSCLTACSYDDSELQDSVSSLNDRIASLESQVERMNSEVSSLQTILNALQQNVHVTDVIETAEGYTLVFSDGTQAIVNHGQDGASGQDAPVIGFTMGEDGVYYWTYTTADGTAFLTDAEGNLLPTTGEDGQDGITPRLSIDAEGYWLVSYDNGNTYQQLLDNAGNPISAIGEKGEPGTSFFSSVTVEEKVVIVQLTNGEVLTLLREQEFAIHFVQTTAIPLVSEKDTCSVAYTIDAADENTFIELYAQGNLTATLFADSISGGHINVQATGEQTEETKLFVFLCNKEHTITTVLTFVSNRDYRINDVVPDTIQTLIGEYMPINRGINPPIIEGGYRNYPNTCVYCSDPNGYPPGEVMSYPVDILFANQDTIHNTLDYKSREGDMVSKEGNGAFISGEGNVFTAFFNIEGTSQGIYIKQALVVSGTKTENGIADYIYTFVLIEKGADPDDKLMPAGAFRVFRDGDGLAENYSWTATRSALAPNWDGLWTMGTKKQ